MPRFTRITIAIAALTLLLTPGAMGAVRPRISSVSPNSGSTAGGTSVVIAGLRFQAGATVTFGGKSAMVVSVAPSSITAVTPAHAAGIVNVVVTNPDGLKGRLASGYTYVNLGQPPQISSISPTSGPTSGGTSAAITGSGFQAGAAVTLGGASATVVGVAPSSIAIVTPAHAAGSVDVVVANPDGQTATLTGGYSYVSGGGGGGSMLWQVQMDGSYSFVRPAVASNGNIYVVDVSGTLHAVSPTGTLLWKVPGAAGFTGKALTVGPDGTIYVASEDIVRAFSPSGVTLWTYTQDPRAFILVGLSVGPDGNLYGVATQGLGVFSLTPSGVLRWTSTELYNRPIVSYGEIVFGPGSAPSSPKQLYFYANHHIRALTLDGGDVFQLNTGGQPVTSPFDGTMHLGNAAYQPDGTLYWLNTNVFSGSSTVVGRDGTTYLFGFGSLFALDPAGATRWTSSDPDFLNVSGVEPGDTRLLLVGNDATDFHGVINAYDTASGSRVWHLDLPPVNGSNQAAERLPAFSADGSVAYYYTEPCLSALNHGCLTAVAVK